MIYVSHISRTYRLGSPCRDVYSDRRQETSRHRYMKRNQLVLKFVFVNLVLMWPTDIQQLAIAVNVEAIAELFAKSNQSPEPPETKPKLHTTPENKLPRISFEKTVFDLGDAGQGTKNNCEFRFTNTGRGLLKIGKISRTCGCTVFHLDKKEYTAGETGTIKGIKGVRPPRTYRVSAGVLFWPFC